MKILLGLMVVGAMSIGDMAAAQAAAQPQPSAMKPGAPVAEALLFVMLTDITLSGEQQAKVDTIRSRARRQLPVMTPGAAPDTAARRQLREVVIQVHDQIRAVLTADQKKLWDRNLAEVRRLTAPDTIPR